MEPRKINTLTAFFISLCLLRGASAQDDATVVVTQEADVIVSIPRLELRDQDHEIRVRELTTSNGATYLIQDQPVTTAQTQLFESMPLEQRQLFLEKRQRALEATLKVLNSAHLGFGVGALLTSGAMKMLPARWQPTELPFEGLGTRSKRHGPLGERGRAVIEEIIHAIDTQLWEHAPFIAESNEFGLTAFASLGGGAAIRKRGLYGSFGMGISIGYNHVEKTLAFEIFQDAERLVQAFPVVVQVAATGKLLLNFANHAGAAPLKPERGHALYPPGPIVVTDFPDALQAGFSQGIGFPPLDTFYAFETKVHRMKWLRVTVSPLVPGMFRISSGAGKAAEVVIMAVRNAYARMTLGLCEWFLRGSYGR